MEKKLFNHGQYQKIKYLGKGAYGKVYKVEKKKKTDVKDDVFPTDFRALKKVKISTNFEAQFRSTYSYGIEKHLLREIKILKESHHDSIVKLDNIFFEKTAKKEDYCCLSLEFLPLELQNDIILNKEVILTEPAIRIIGKKIASALNYLHNLWILHRDVTTKNILLHPNGDVRLLDFGLSRILARNEKSMTQGVVTCSYRAPEVLYGSNLYSDKIDVWSFGCVIAEMYLRRPLFIADNSIEALRRIYAICGTPNYKDENGCIINEWKDVELLQWYTEMKPKNKTPFAKIEDIKASPEAYDLLEKTLTINPEKRITMQEVLDHPFFKHELNYEPNFLKSLEDTIKRRNKQGKLQNSLQKKIMPIIQLKLH